MADHGGKLGKTHPGFGEVGMGLVWVYRLEKRQSGTTKESSNVAPSRHVFK